MNNEFMTLQQVADLTHTNKQTVVKWVKTMGLKASQPGGPKCAIIVSRPNLEAFLKSHTINKNKGGK